MTGVRVLLSVALAALIALGGCATAPINPPIAHADPTVGYRMQNRPSFARHKEDIVVLAFSGGGTRAAAFSYGVLEVLRDTEVLGPKGERQRLLDLVDVITGVSGGSFTALAYGLYGDRLFGEYEQRFLKRNVEGELIGRVLNPVNWGSLASPDWGRSELAADLYDEILFDGATFADLQRKSGPMIVAAATDLTSGGRFYYTQTMFDILCSDLSAVKLRAPRHHRRAFRSLACDDPQLGGTCDDEPCSSRARQVSPLPARGTRSSNCTGQYYADSLQRPFFHLVDGGVADNLGMRGSRHSRRARRCVSQVSILRRLRAPPAVFVVNAISITTVRLGSKKSAPAPSMC
jgi:NTE family protein